MYGVLWRAQASNPQIFSQQNCIFHQFVKLLLFLESFPLYGTFVLLGSSTALHEQLIYALSSMIFSILTSLTRRKKEVHSLTTLAIDLGLHGSWQIFFYLQRFDYTLIIFFRFNYTLIFRFDYTLIIFFRLPEENYQSIIEMLQIKNFCQLP